jgi:hypothetical protein
MLRELQEGTTILEDILLNMDILSKVIRRPDIRLLVVILQPDILLPVVIRQLDTHPNRADIRRLATLNRVDIRLLVILVHHINQGMAMDPVWEDC